jgi:protein-disulfide isomerase
VIPQLIERYVDTGKARYVYRDFPLTELHASAQKASEAAVCAGQQGKYWDMNEKLFATSSEWTADGADPGASFKGYAKDLGLDTDAFAKCLDSGDAALDVKAEQMAGESFGVDATPFFFVNDLPVRGGLPIDLLGRVIDYVAAGGPTPEIVPSGEDFHVLGNTQTAMALTVAFVDYASPESAQHATEVLPQLIKQYIDTGQMLYILHPWADSDGSPSFQAAAAAECAGQQDKYWEMHDQLFAEQAKWTSDADPQALFVGYAEGLGLNKDDFTTCLSSDWARQRVQAGSVVGALYGVPSAPVFLFNNGTGQQGSPTFDQFKSVIDSIVNPQ